MKDIRDIEVKEGDLVSFVYRWGKSSELCHGEVIGFTSQMVKITFRPRVSIGNHTSNYMPHNICVIQQNKETKMKEL